MISCKQARPLAATAFVAIFAAAILDASITIAAAAGLFDPATATEMRAAPPSGGTMRGGLRGRDEGALRDRLVTLNTSELARIVPVGLDNARDRLDRARGLSRAVTLDLFPGVSVTAERKDIEAPDEGGYVWAGEADGNQPGFVTLVINDNSVLGHIQTGGRLYSIEPVSGRLHRIIEINQSKILDDMHVPPLPEVIQNKSEAAEPPAEAAEATVTTIRVLVANTINARNECRAGTAAQKQTCMQQRIALAISLNNQAFTRSGVLIRFVRVGGQNEVNYADTTLYGGNNYIGVLCDLTGFNNTSSCTGIGNNSAAKFNSLRSKRTAVAADLVILMRKEGAACGIAWVPDPPTAAHAIYGFSVTTSTKGGVYNCVEGNTFAHETGHNMGLRHDRIQHQLETGGAYPPGSKFNFGHVNQPQQFFTIMAYRSSCGGSCTRIPNFSNPQKKYPNASGTPTGVNVGVGGPSGSAYAVKTLNVTRNAVGGYR